MLLRELRSAASGGSSLPSMEALMHVKESCRGTTSFIGKLTLNFDFFSSFPVSSFTLISSLKIEK